MSLWNRALTWLDRLDAPRTAHAHCDIPCGIYDPRTMQIAAQTVTTLTQKMQALTPPDGGDQNVSQLYDTTLARMAVVRDEHANIVKNEVRILWGDYFKPPHVQQYPNLHEHMWLTLKQAGTARQNMDLDACRKLQDMVDQIAAWFWESKGASDVQRRVQEGRPIV